MIVDEGEGSTPDIGSAGPMAYQGTGVAWNGRQAGSML
jgi:hypothetical protein